MEVRKRNKRPSSIGSGGDPSRSRNVKAEKVDQGFTRLIIFVFLGVLAGFSVTALYPETLDKFFNLLGIKFPEHAIVLDAGSTGSRVLAFTFNRGVSDHQLHLVDELWKEVKPGLSSYAGNPQEAANSIKVLLDAAKERIPKEHWETTPVVLKATAGLRLLPSEQADAIIHEVEAVLQGSGFKPVVPLVEIMNPRDEGLYAWFTVNFLLNLFGTGPMTNTSASLDLGGGSTQITFAPATLPVPGLEGRKHFMHEVNKSPVYTHSYLGLGLMAAREAIFTQGQPIEGDASRLSSPCMSSSKPQSWSFHGNNYVLSRLGGSTSFEKCLEVVRRVIKSNEVHKPVELQVRQVAVFSYFYDRAVDNQILAEGVTEGRVQIRAYIEAAKKACANDLDTLQCVDLTFISSLLTDGYGLTLDKEVQVYKKIAGYEASWALGAAYNLIEGQ